MSVGLQQRIKKLETGGFGTERDDDILRKRQLRSEAARIFIPECKNPKRREKSLEDPERFLKTYFAARYSRPFGRLHDAMIEAMVEIAANGGKQAIAAPRGRGKSEITRGMLVYLLCRGLIFFPVVVCQTTADARRTYADFRKKLMANELLHDDFPEICAPVRALEGAPQRASKQHIDGQLTNIVWTAEALRLADVPQKYRFFGEGPQYGGFRMEYRGLDAAIRGLNSEGDRPDFILIDDPETHESAKSETQIEDREKAIEQDIAGLADDPDNLKQIMLTTIQNRYCLSYKYTDPEQKPAWMGKRFGWVVSWPDEWEGDPEQSPKKWNEYIALRAQDQRNGDRYGRTATQFYLDNRAAMEAGGELLADNYNTRTLGDGWQTVHSAWQVVFNTIADTSYEAFCTEYQNDPPESEQITTLELTHGKVASSLSGFYRGEVPSGLTCTTMGIDIGKYESWFVKVGWDENCTGWVIDYGQIRTVGLDKSSSASAIETALLEALVRFAEEQSEQDMAPLLTLVDSGDYSDAIYEVCQRLSGENYFPSKGGGGQGRAFTMPRPSDDKQPFLEAYASRLYDDKRREFWLYNVNTEWWKNWTQERWLQPTFTDQVRTPGSLAVFSPENDDIRLHTRFAKSMVSERLEHVPLPDKGYKAKWTVIDRRNNHWLDAIALACAAAGCVGIRLVRPEPVKQQPKPEKQQPPRRSGRRPYLITQR